MDIPPAILETESESLSICAHAVGDAEINEAVYTLQVLVLVILLAALYGLYRSLMHSPTRSGRALAYAAGTAFAVCTCILALVLRPLAFDTAIISSDSMRPTLEVGDRILANKIVYKYREPRRGEIVTFSFPSKTPGDPDDTLIKRVIGLPGDTIRIQNCTLYRNGRRVTEPYICQVMEYSTPPRKVTEGRLFVLGDNRNVSDDSHVWGMLDRSRVTGKAVVRFWPPGRTGSIR